NRITSVTDPAGNTQYLAASEESGLALASVNGSADSAAQLISPDQVSGSRTDANGKTTTFTTDLYGDLTSSTDADRHQTTNTCEANGNLHYSQGPKDPGTPFPYDRLGNLTQKSGAAALGTVTEHWVFGDTANPAKPTQYTDALGDVTLYAYDSHGNVVY